MQPRTQLIFGRGGADGENEQQAYHLSCLIPPHTRKKIIMIHKWMRGEYTPISNSSTQKGESPSVEEIVF